MNVKILYDSELITKMDRSNFYNEYEKELNLYLQEGYKIVTSNMLTMGTGTWTRLGIYTLLEKE